LDNGTRSGKIPGMKTLRSYVCGAWHEADGGFATLVNPSTEEEVARASSGGVDFEALLRHARERGLPALRALGFEGRGQLLKSMSKTLFGHREELLELSRVNTGTTVSDGAFDIDGATGTLAYYAALARSLPAGPLREGDAAPLGKSDAFWTQHVLLPRDGVAVHINAFNFPAWGFAEKAACALLAGMPVITKPATATAWVTERCYEILVDAGILPDGALQLVCGGTGDLLDRLGPQDVLALTGSAGTARMLRSRPNLLAANTRINVEADSLNAAVLVPGAASGVAFDLFIRDVVREIRQKSGQKCTAVRRVLVPTALLGRVQDALAEKLAGIVTGNPEDASVTMGPLATADQLRDALEGVALLGRETRTIAGGAARIDGVGSPPGRGFFIAPTLLRADDAYAARAVHEREVFAPVATLLPYDGTPGDAARIVALGGGMLVTSIYGDDRDWLRAFLANGGGYAGRVYIGSDASAPEMPGSGIVFPAALHGGPGRAGGGEELGGLAGLRLYSQRVALQGNRELLAELAGPAAG
jgi:oxepin-CoA hydrolase/3-oxo-5,6-dehydrosuberyl-CoA semialdehyde dehydrogenase